LKRGVAVVVADEGTPAVAATTQGLQAEGGDAAETTHQGGVGDGRKMAGGAGEAAGGGVAGVDTLQVQEEEEGGPLVPVKRNRKEIIQEGAYHNRENVMACQSRRHKDKMYSGN
jgi:hypothetical protein